MRERYDVIVVGAGPGGYMAAIRAAQLGLRTAVVEKGRAGGTCLNRGCIPAKAMLQASALLRSIKEAGQYGIRTGEVSFDYGKLLSYREETVDRLRQGVEGLLAANGVAVLAGRGRLEKGKVIKVFRETAGEVSGEYEAGAVILAAGSVPAIPPIPGISLPGVLTSDGLLELKERPESLTIIGGGAVGVEFASIYADLGSRVELIEAMPGLLPNMDREISQNLRMILKKRGIGVHTSASVRRIEERNGRYACVFEEKGKEREAVSEYILCAVGRRPAAEGLFGEGAEPAMERGHVVTDAGLCTSIPGVYAVGDLAGGIQLAHLAGAQGIYVAERIAGEEPAADLRYVPACVYTEPEIASVGMTQKEAEENGIDAETGKFLMGANGRSVIAREERGFIKIVTEKETGVILGAQMMCARASDMIGELAAAAANGLTVRQLLKGIRPHPTYNEGMAEALEAVSGKAIHAMPARRLG